MRALREALVDVIAGLEHEMRRRAGREGDEGGIGASRRQLGLLDALQRAVAAAEWALGNAPREAALVGLRAALAHAGALIGFDVSDLVLDRIFSTFCVGK